MLRKIFPFGQSQRLLKDRHYYEEPYQLIKPHPKSFWYGVMLRVVPALLRRVFHVAQWSIEGAHHLAASLQNKSGILLSPNHTRPSDIFLMALLSRNVRQPFFFAASWHHFIENRFQRFLLPRIGWMSVFRESGDPEAIEEGASIVANATRPLVLFPEGTYYRTNDVVGPMFPGVAIIAKRAVATGTRPVVVHPVVMKYWCIDDPGSRIYESLGRLEERLSLTPESEATAPSRLARIVFKWVMSLEADLLDGNYQDSSLRLADYISHLTESLLQQVASRNQISASMNVVPLRIHRVQKHVISTLRNGTSPGERLSLLQDLDKIRLCRQLYPYYRDQCLGHESRERVVEVIQRLYEDMSDQLLELNMGPMGVRIQIANAISIGPHHTIAEILESIHQTLQSTLNELADAGCPQGWIREAD